MQLFSCDTVSLKYLVHNQDMILEVIKWTLLSFKFSSKLPFATFYTFKANITSNKTLSLTVKIVVVICSLKNAPEVVCTHGTHDKF